MSGAHARGLTKRWIFGCDRSQGTTVCRNFSFCASEPRPSNYRVSRMHGQRTHLGDPDRATLERGLLLSGGEVRLLPSAQGQSDAVP